MEPRGVWAGVAAAEVVLFLLDFLKNCMVDCGWSFEMERVGYRCTDGDGDGDGEVMGR